ncbi:hypothetical protein [Micromonospora sp. WMMD1082]|uniref:hypothetical protein n=1 Tax=Micromonospora sp. WMMD1082 TaxID=3016104 RepID=UPI0024180C2E|nr:hypothetical protein [Micromonospora sp. WMMD1082]MDG4792433.1 hypothetical protein [Micromonospora sp. WMMD1082]
MRERPITYRAAMAAEAVRIGRAVDALPARLDDQHTPLRPAWTCGTCDGDAPWPCPPARVRLAERYGRDRVSLSMYVGALLTAALDDRPQDDPGELTTRFVAWTRCVCGATACFPVTSLR